MHNQDLFLEVKQNNRFALSKAITLMESHRTEDYPLIKRLLDKMLGHRGSKTFRVAISGAPGVGKSTFINTFVSHIASIGKKVAVLTVDPSSVDDRGSILGDKVRMEKIANHPNVFIRSTPHHQTPGGVSAATWDTIHLCEEAGYDLILVETVGVGQVELRASKMTDFFIYITQPGSGDDLQGLKKGIMEIADLIVINKSDGDLLSVGLKTKKMLESVLQLLNVKKNKWTVTVQTCSAIDNTGITEVWESIKKFFDIGFEYGNIEKTRRAQEFAWYEDTKKQILLRKIKETILDDDLNEQDSKYHNGEVTAYHALRNFSESLDRKLDGLLTNKKI